MELINQHNLKKISKILSYKRYKKILVVSGAKSYFSSGSDKVINNLISQKHKLIFFSALGYIEHTSGEQSYSPILKRTHSIALLCL